MIFRKKRKSKKPTTDQNINTKEESKTTLTDENSPKKDKKKKSKNIGHNERVRRLFSWILSIVLVLTIVSIIFSRIIPERKELALPQEAVSTVMTPIQSTFSSITNNVVNYLRKLKYRNKLEEEYNNLRAENERLTYENMELQVQISDLEQYKKSIDEFRANVELNPIVGKVIDRELGNYFSVFTIDKGKKDGIEPYMAVTLSGGLIGYTENVKTSQANVRTVIDSNFNIAALIDSSRAQGIVSGSLGIDGEPMCRMFDISGNTLPRPGDLVMTSGVGLSFPKGIPIGTVRESTRGMERNRQYVVIEPIVNLDSIEYVQVLRYKPEPEPVIVRGIADEMMILPVDTPFPYMPEGVGIDGSTPSPSPSPTPSPTPHTSETDNSQNTSTTTNSISYMTPRPTDDLLEPTPTPTPSPSPSPTPKATVALDDLTID